MANILSIKKSSVASKVPLPADLGYGELAINYTDGKLYFKNSSNVIKNFITMDEVNAADYVTRTTDQTITGNKTFSNLIIGSINGNAATATTLQTARTLWGQSFNGSANVSGDLTSVGNITGSGNLTIASGGSTTNVIIRTNGADRAVFDSVGNVGINVTPNTWSSPGWIQLSAGIVSNNPVMYTGANMYLDGAWKYTSSGPASLYQEVNGNHYWYTAPSGIANTSIPWTNLMTLDASGNLGIGAASQGRKLEVWSGNGTTDIITGSSSSGFGAVLRWNNIAGEGHLYTTGAYPLLLGTNGSANVRIDTDGNLSIGAVGGSYRLHVEKALSGGWTPNTSTPIANLHNSVQEANSTSMVLYSSLFSDGTFTGVKAGSVASGSYSADFVVANRNVGTFQENLRVTAAGNLGVNTASPQAKLHVAGDIQVRNPGAAFTKIRADAQIIAFVNATDDGYVPGVIVGQTLAFGTGSGNTALSLDVSGNLGLGVTPSAWGFGGNLELLATNNIAFHGSGNLLFNAFYSVPSGGYLYKYSAAAARYQATNGGQHQWFTAPVGTAGNPISFTQAMTLDASGRLMIGATAATGTSKLVVGQGISTAVNATAVLNTANAAQPGLVISNWTGSATTTGPHVLFDNSTFGSWYIGSGNAINSFDIGRTWGTPDLRIDSTGNIITTGNITSPSFIGTLYGASIGAPDKMIWAPSLQYPTWGLNYNEGTLDKIEFLAAGVAKAWVALDDGSASFSGNVTLPGVFYGTTAVSATLTGTTTTATTQISLASWGTTGFSALEILLVAVQGNIRHTTKLLVTHDGTTAIATEYATLKTSVSLFNADVDISAGSVRLLVTPTSATSTSFRASYNYVV